MDAVNVPGAVESEGAAEEIAGPATGGDEMAAGENEMEAD